MNILRSIKGTNELFNGVLYNSLPSIKNLCSKLERRNLFFNDEVQNLLKKLTKADYEKIFRVQKLGGKVSTSDLKFMTDEELEKARNESLRKGQKKLQMPPILPPREEINEIIAVDEKLASYSKHKYVFTDITFGRNDRNRYIVVRDTDGILRQAKWAEREKCNEIYFPRRGRKLRIPQMFKSPHFEEVLNKGFYEFILNRACTQFEPDDPLYISITRATYNKIAEEKKFQDFESSRHFGSMVYYFTEQEKLAPLLIHYLNYDRPDDILMVIKLHSLLHPGKKYSEAISSGNDLSLLKKFIAECYPDNAELELALKSYEEYISQPKSEAAV